MNREELVRDLYSKNISAPEIGRKLGMTPWQVYDSLIRQGIQRRSYSEQSKIRFEQKPLSFSLKTKLSSRERDLMVSALMLYQGEGAKNGPTVDLANSDPQTISIFLKFLRKICRIDEKRLRFYLYCFSDQNPDALISFWSKLLRVKRDQFTKPYVRQNSGKLRRIMQNGVLHVRYSDKKLHTAIMQLNYELIRGILEN